VRLAVGILLSALAATITPSTGAAALSPASRAAIDATLDAFVPAAVARRHPERAWRLATSAMHVGGTRAGWAHGDLPVPPFPAAGTTFHDWTVSSVHSGVASLVLLLHPRRGTKVGSVSYDVRMRKVGGRWLVDSFVPAASFAAPGSVSGITASPDLAPAPAAPPSAARGRISGTWLAVVPAVLIGLIVLVPAVFFSVHRVRDRRAARRYGSATRVV